jgi:hypothetical protein
VVAVAMAVIASYYAVSRYYLWSVERRLITTGQRVQAEVMGYEPLVDALPNRLVQPDGQVDVRYTHAGQTYRVHGALAGRKEPILTRTKIQVIIDPAEPTRWTARLEPTPLQHELLPAMLLTPFVVVPLLVALVNRRRVLRIYRDGEALLARVVGTGHSAAAPGSRLIRCAPHTGGDGRVIKTALPTRKTPPVGQNLWLIAPPNRPQQAVPAALFE